MSNSTGKPSRDVPPNPQIYVSPILIKDNAVSPYTLAAFGAVLQRVLVTESPACDLPHHLPVNTQEMVDATPQMHHQMYRMNDTT